MLILCSFSKDKCRSKVGFSIDMCDRLEEESESSYCTITLFIHDIIFTGECSLAVDRVIAVDADYPGTFSRNSNSRNTQVDSTASAESMKPFRLSVLMQGSVVQGHCPNESSYGETILSEGSTEFQSSKENCDDSVEDDIESCNFSDLLLASHLSQHAAYYVCICETDGYNIKLLRTIKISGLIKDQIPNYVKIVNEDEIIISGNCACLLRINLSSGLCTSLTGDDDSSHESAACITVVAVSQSGKYIVTGDHIGLISLWREKMSALTLDAGARIISIVVSEKGNHICCGLRDSLLLIGVNEVGNSEKLYVRSVLDMVTGYRCFYACRFMIESNYLSIWRAMEGQNCSTIFSHWMHPNVESFQYDYRYHFLWSEDTDHQHISLRDEAINDELVESACLKASRFIVFHKFEDALREISNTRAMFSSFRYQSTLILMHLRLASIALLVPSTPNACLVDVTTLIPFHEDQKWLFNDILGYSSSCDDQQNSPIHSFCSNDKKFNTASIHLIDLLPQSADRGSVFAINEVLMLSATCWRSNAFSQHFNTIKIHNLKTEDKYFASVPPEPLVILNPLPSDVNSNVRISAMAISELGTYLCVASDAGTASSVEICLWSIVTGSFVSRILFHKAIIGMEFYCSSTLLNVWALPHGSDDVSTMSTSRIFVDWGSLTVESTFSVQEHHDSLIRYITTINNPLNASDIHLQSPSSLKVKGIALISSESDDSLVFNEGEIRDIIDGSLCQSSVAFDELFTNPFDFTDCGEKWRELVPGTRSWVFKDLENWLADHKSSPDSSTYGFKKLWILQSPTGYGKSVVAATISKTMEASIVSKCFFVDGYASMLNEFSLISSISIQLCNYFGTPYKMAILDEFIHFGNRLIKSIFKGKEGLMGRWGLPFLTLGRRTASNKDFLNFVDIMISRIFVLQKNLKIDGYDKDEKEEITCLCELLSSFQLVSFQAQNFVIPLFQILPTADIFDALISKPLENSYLTTTSGEKIILLDGLNVNNYPNGQSIIRLVRMIALRSPDWLRIVITTRKMF